MAGAAAVCPWKCLDPSPPSPSQPLAQKKTFAQALHAAIDVPLSQLPRPCIKGDSVSIKISENEYIKGLDSCKMNLHGRLILSKGDKPIKFNDLRDKLSQLWKPIGQWRMTSLGKGYFEFSFSSTDDLRSVWAVGTWSLKPGLLRLSQWTADFNPKNQKQTHVQCWVRLYDLPKEYWRPRILFEIASAIGTPISINEVTQKRVFGHYARVLVDFDLTAEPVKDILVEREKYAFYIGVDYEKLPPFCNFCHSIGHSIAQCNRKEGAGQSKNQRTQREPQDKHTRQPVYVGKTTNLGDDNGTNTLSNDGQEGVQNTAEPKNVQEGVQNNVGFENVQEDTQAAVQAEVPDVQGANPDQTVAEDSDHIEVVYDETAAQNSSASRPIQSPVEYVSETSQSTSNSGNTHSQVHKEMRILTKFWSDALDDVSDDPSVTAGYYSDPQQQLHADSTATEPPFKLVISKSNRKKAGRRKAPSGPARKSTHARAGPQNLA